MSYFEPRRPALSSRNVFTLYKAVLLAWGTDISVLSLCTPDEGSCRSRIQMTATYPRVHPHPYMPTDLHLPNYTPPIFSRSAVLGVFFPVVALILAWCIHFIRGSKSPGLKSSTEGFIFTWFVLCGFIHFVIEGSFAIYGDFHADNGQHNVFWTFMASLWKEYSHADSRYAWRESFIVTMEAFTAFAEGPAAFVIAWAMAKGKSWRYPLMMLTAFGEFYGCFLYFLTSWHTEFRDMRPEPLYWWFYFVILNTFWIVVPILICVHAWKKMASAVHFAEKSEEEAEAEKKTG